MNHEQDIEMVKYFKKCNLRESERSLQLRRKYDIENWAFDGRNGLLKFILKDGMTVSFPSQIAGTWNEHSNTFTWAWANVHMPTSLIEAAYQVKQFGEERSWSLLTEPEINCDEEMAWSFTNITKEVSNNRYAYRGTDGKGTYYFFVFDEEEGQAMDGDIITEKEVAPVFDGDYEYDFYTDGVSITKYKGKEKTVIIPQMIENRPVVAIGDDSFYSNEELTEVTIPEGVEAVEISTFEGCASLVSINLPQSLEFIGVSAFANCSSLKSIIIPNNVTDIENGAFENCKSLVSITLPGNSINFGENIFDGCDKLTIYSSTGSEAENYAKQNDINFVVIE